MEAFSKTKTIIKDRVDDTLMEAKEMESLRRYRQWTTLS
jgi:hypothetical protein